MATIKSDIEASKKESETRGEELIRIREENAKLKQESDDLEERLQKKKENIKSTETQKTVQQKALNERNQQFDNSMSQKAHKEQIRNDFERDVHDLEKKNKRLDRELQILHRKFTELTEQKGEREIERDNLKIQ